MNNKQINKLLLSSESSYNNRGNGKKSKLELRRQYEKETRNHDLYIFLKGQKKYKGEITISYERIKQTKVRHDTWRRADIPDTTDDKLNNYYYANFLSDKNTHYDYEYENIDHIININTCDAKKK